MGKLFAGVEYSTAGPKLAGDQLGDRELCQGSIFLASGTIMMSAQTISSIANLNQLPLELHTTDTTGWLSNTPYIVRIKGGL